MNRRRLLQALLATPVVAALTPLIHLPTPSGATAVTAFKTSLSPSRTRWLRYRLTTRDMVSEFSEPIGQFLGTDAERQTLYVPTPCAHLEADPASECIFDIEAQMSDDGVTWRSADASLEIVRV